VFDVDGRLIGTESFGMYEVLEELEDLERACKLTDLPFGEINKFMALASAISSDPKALFYVSAYRIAKHHLEERLQGLCGGTKASYFRVFENNLLTNKLIDHRVLGEEPAELAPPLRSVTAGGFTALKPDFRGFLRLPRPAIGARSRFDNHPSHS
jgi:hypothetical protein